MMQAKDIMTVPAITVAPDTTVLEIAALLLERRISGVPVVANGRVVGVVSEGDLLHRHEIGTDHSFARMSWWQRLIKGDRMPAEYVKSHGRRARDVMTRSVVSVNEATPLELIASLLESRDIKRAPVLRGTRLMGIVSRADLLRALLMQTKTADDPPAQTDESIRLRLVAELEQQRWWRSDWSAVEVIGGIVHYRGVLQDEDERRAARVAAENVPGVRGVEDNRMAVPNWAPMV